MSSVGCGSCIWWNVGERVKLTKRGRGRDRTSEDIPTLVLQRHSTARGSLTRQSSGAEVQWCQRSENENGDARNGFKLLLY